MKKGSMVITILIVAVIAAIIYFFLFPNFQIPETKEELTFKNDIISVENLAVTNLAPYEGDEIVIEFDLQNNGDKPVSEINVNFFDTPGFESIKLECQLVGKDNKSEARCDFFSLEPSDSRHISLTLKAKEVDSPTPFKISFSIKYQCNIGDMTNTCMGSREVLIPIVDGVIKKEPSFKFTQSEPSLGPVKIDIQPQLERQKKIGDKIIKEYWGIVDQPFTVKFVLSNVGTEDKVKEVNIPEGKLVIETDRRLTPIDDKGRPLGLCDFDLSVREESTYTSKKPINETFDTLLCTFKSTSKSFEPEFVSRISVKYEYTYEFIRSVDFIVQPR